MENTIPWILLGEVLHRYFRALLDYFCLHFLCRCRGTVAAFPPNLVCPRICILSFCKNKNIFFSFYHHEIHSYPILVRFKGRVCWATTKTKPFIWRWTPPYFKSYGLVTTLLRARKWKPLPSPARIRGDVFVLEHLRHDTRDSKMEIVSLFSHIEGEAVVYTCCRKYEWGLGWTQRQILPCSLPYVPYGLSTKGDPRLYAVRGVYRCSLG